MYVANTNPLLAAYKSWNEVKELVVPSPLLINIWLVVIALNLTHASADTSPVMFRFAELGTRTWPPNPSNFVDVAGSRWIAPACAMVSPAT